MYNVVVGHDSEINAQFGKNLWRRTVLDVNEPLVVSAWRKVGFQRGT
jgi:hypothetical protein